MAAPTEESTAAEEGTAAGIYGVIVGSAVMVSAHPESAIALDVAVLVTLTIYWVAERYSRLVAERIHSGHRPTWAHVRQALTTGWEMVTATLLPLLTLSSMSLLGAELDTAVLTALGCSTLILCVAGWRMGQDGKLTLPERLLSTTVAGAFGVVMVVLKTLLH